MEQVSGRDVENRGWSWRTGEHKETTAGEHKELSADQHLR